MYAYLGTFKSGLLALLPISWLDFKRRRYFYSYSHFWCFHSPFDVQLRHVLVRCGRSGNFRNFFFSHFDSRSKLLVKELGYCHCLGSGIFNGIQTRLMPGREQQRIKINLSRWWKSIYISAILKHMSILLISVWSTRIDLRNETFILNISEGIPIKIHWSRCWKSVYISAILQHMSILLISVWSTTIDLRNETFILKVHDEIPGRMANK